MALGAIRAARRAGLGVPDDVSIVGFDDSALMNCTDPPLTTVRQPIDLMGRMVIELLTGQIAGTPVPHDELLFEPELVVRGSTGPPPPLADPPSSDSTPARRPCSGDARSVVELSTTCCRVLALLRRMRYVAAQPRPGCRDGTTRRRKDPRDRTGAGRHRHAPVTRRRTAAGRSVGRPDGPARSSRPTIPSGGGARSSTRSTSAASLTRNGDGTGDLAGVRSRLPYLRDLGVDAIWFTPWYLSPLADGGYDVADYRAIDPAFGTLAEAEALIAEALDHGIRTIIDVVPNHVSSRHAWFQAALAAGPGSPSASGSGSGPAGARTATSPPRPGHRSSRAARRGPATTNADGDARRVVPPPVHGRAAGPQLGPSRRPRRARGDPPLLVRPRRRGRAHRLRRAARQGSGDAGGPGGARAGRPSAPRPRRAPRHLPRLAGGRRRAIPGRASWSARCGSRTSSGSPATSGRTSSTPPSTSTSWPGRGTPPACARRSTRRSRHTPRSARRPPGCCRTTTSPGRSRATAAGLVVRLRPQAVRDADGPRAGSTSGSGRRTAHGGPARLALHLPGRRARARRGRGPARPRSRTRCMPAPAASTRVATGAASRCRGAGRPAVRVQPGDAAAMPWLSQPAHWADLTVSRQESEPGSMLRLYRARCASDEPRPGSGTARSRGSRPIPTSSRSRGATTSSASPTCPAPRCRCRPIGTCCWPARTSRTVTFRPTRRSGCARTVTSRRSPARRVPADDR